MTNARCGPQALTPLRKKLGIVDIHHLPAIKVTGAVAGATQDPSPGGLVSVKTTI